MADFSLARAAYRDLEDIDEYTRATWGENQRDRYVKALFDQFGTLAALPSMGRLRPELAEGARSFAYEHHVIFYELHAERCHILRVLHKSRDVEAAFTR
jgi:toxin ParE1/3/4